jgi:mono/diheme cytochrome c family protein
MKLRRRYLFAGLLLLPLALAFVSWAGVMFMAQGGMTPLRLPDTGTRQLSSNPQVLERGSYLARIGNCAGCHTRQGGQPYAGGRGFGTAYGRIYSSNLTPDPSHGIGSWTREEFHHAMRHGVSRSGVQSPVFPYANFAHLAAADLDALFDYLSSVPAVAEAATADVLEFPANLPGAMLFWRMLNYRPVALAEAAEQSVAWRRGRDLVNGIGHCAICHGSRGSLAALSDAAQLGGSPISGWYAPPLDQLSLQRYAPGQLAHYLRGGLVDGRGGYGGMADVIAHSLQHLQATDADSIETYLRSLPPAPPAATRPAPLKASDQHIALGNRLYTEHCADCHGSDGEGEAGKYPALQDSPALTGPDPINAIKLVLFGAVPPSTPLNPRPYSMPPYAQQLSADEVAALINAMRQRWGQRDAAPVTADEVRSKGGIAPRWGA